MRRRASCPRRGFCLFEIKGEGPYEDVMVHGDTLERAVGTLEREVLRACGKTTQTRTTHAFPAERGR